MQRAFKLWVAGASLLGDCDNLLLPPGELHHWLRGRQITLAIGRLRRTYKTRANFKLVGRKRFLQRHRNASIPRLRKKILTRGSPRSIAILAGPSAASRSKASNPALSFAPSGIATSVAVSAVATAWTPASRRIFASRCFFLSDTKSKPNWGHLVVP